MKFFVLLIASASLVINVSANSSGTGSCAAGIACVGGTHLDFGPNSASMRQGLASDLPTTGVTVSINGQTLTPGTAATFDSGVDLTWTITSTMAPYKGIFVRVEATDDNAFTNTGSGTGLANVALCDSLAQNVIGVNHNSAVTKTTNSGVLNFSGSGAVSMDVTIVFDNTQFSLYASSNFPLTIGGGSPVAPSPVAPVPTGGTPTTSPAGTPTAPVPTAPAPVTAPTAPVAPTAPAPVTAPTAPTAPTTPTAPTSDDECPEGSKKSGKGSGGGKGKGGESGKGKGMMKCKGGMMMGMETKSPKSPKTPKADEPKSTKAPKSEGKGDDARRYLK